MGVGIPAPSEGRESIGSDDAIGMERIDGLYLCSKRNNEDWECRIDTCASIVPNLSVRTFLLSLFVSVSYVSAP